MTEIHSKRVIHLSPFTVQDETLAALEDEIKVQASDDITNIEAIDKFVLDSNTNGGLDSHAAVLISQGGES